MATNTDKTGAQAGMNRRAMLSIGLAMPFIAVSRTAFAQALTTPEEPISPERLHALSVALIGPAADDTALSQAYHEAFGKVAPDFLMRAAVLAKAMQAQGVTTPETFSGSALAQDSGYHATAVALTAAWYLGHAPDDDHGGQVVAYEKALMWRPTDDIMVIPSYARGGPDYWARQIPQIKQQIQAG